MPTAETKRKLVSGGVFVMPLVLVQTTAMLLGGPGPVTVSATTTELPPVVGPAVVSAPAVLSEEVRLAAAHVEGLGEQPFGGFPFYDASGGSGDPVVVDPGIEPAPEFVVQAILSSPAGTIALIDNERYRVGDFLVSSGWRIVAIDGDGGEVTARDPVRDRVVTYAIRE